MEKKLSGTLLVIDDDEGMRCLLEALIEDAGGTAICAATAAEAIKALTSRKEEICACLLDLNLEDRPGEELYDELAKISPELPIFPMSGCFGEEIAERLGARKTAGIITKPFAGSSLISQIAKGLLPAP